MWVLSEVVQGTDTTDESTTVMAGLTEVRGGSTGVEGLTVSEYVSDTDHIVALVDLRLVRYINDVTILFPKDLERLRFKGVVVAGIVEDRDWQG